MATRTGCVEISQLFCFKQSAARAWNPSVRLTPSNVTYPPSKDNDSIEAWT